MRIELGVEPVALELCCPPLGEQERFSAEEAERVAASLKALSDSVRLSIVSILAGRADRELTTREIAPLVKLSEPTVSHHLKRLEEAGLVVPRREGARVHYRLVIPRIREIAAILDVRCDCDSACNC